MANIPLCKVLLTIRSILGVSVLIAQGHFNVWKGRAWDRSTNRVINVWPALELPHLHVHYVLETKLCIFSQHCVSVSLHCACEFLYIFVCVHTVCVPVWAVEWQSLQRHCQPIASLSDCCLIWWSMSAWSSSESQPMEWKYRLIIRDQIPSFITHDLVIYGSYNAGDAWGKLQGET